MPSKSASARLRIVSSAPEKPKSISEQVGSSPTALTVDDVASFLNLAKKTVYAMSSAGRIPAIKIGSVLRFDPVELADWIDSRTLSTTRRAA